MCRSPVYRQKMKEEIGGHWVPTVYAHLNASSYHGMLMFFPLTEYLAMVISDESDLGFKGPSKTHKGHLLVSISTGISPCQ